MINKIISGGQTGVDSAALDAAATFGVSCGGWCPKGRISENGVIPEKYKFLQEISGDFGADKENYSARTKANIKDSDATLILVPGAPPHYQIQGGTLLTIQEAKSQGKPLLIMDLSQPSSENIESMLSWIKKEKIKIINIAGPRESNCPGVSIYQLSKKFLEDFLSLLKS